jgi:hypothetical protein
MGTASISMMKIATNKMFEFYGLPAPIQEYKFHPTRKWRLDFAFPEIKLAIEQEGAVWISGRHNHPMGFIKDMEKYNALSECGWYLLRYQPKKFDWVQIKRTYEKLKYFRNIYVSNSNVA